MSIIDSYIENLSREYPVLTEQVDGEVRPVSAKDRQSIITEWATSLHQTAISGVRAERDTLLAASDWTQTPDAPVDAKAWAKYRQELRDLPESITDPTQPITWPSPPE
jgi:hypothetical protein